MLSESVGKAMKMTGGPEAQETATFVEMFDKFFDALNVGNFQSGRYQRKPFKVPYFSESDVRLSVSFSYLGNFHIAFTTFKFSG